MSNPRGGYPRGGYSVANAEERTQRSESLSNPGGVSLSLVAEQT